MEVEQAFGGKISSTLPAIPSKKSTRKKEKKMSHWDKNVDRREGAYSLPCPFLPATFCPVYPLIVIISLIYLNLNYKKEMHIQLK